MVRKNSRINLNATTINLKTLRMKKFLILLIFLTINKLFAADTLRVMQYNILAYGNYTTYCTTANNNINMKNAALREITQYAKPDIFTVNEISQWQPFHQQILDSVLNINGVTKYRKVPYSNNAGSDIINMCYYNSNKITYHSMVVAQSYVRDINIYRFYYNAPSLANGDTAFVTCIQAHLKAGDATSDPQNPIDRDTMTTRLMRYLNKINKADNYMMMGDFNVYSSSENCFQRLVNQPNLNSRFYDPIDKMGNWNNNSSYAPYHTQSTHTVSGCAASGGMDDRFDFILLSNMILNGIGNYKYIQNSYKALGNDGQHYNNAINSSPQNNSVPSNVLNALYNNSDHLPIIIDLLVTPTVSVSEYQKQSPFFNLTIENPVKENLNFSLPLEKSFKCKLNIIDIQGKSLLSISLQLTKGENKIKLPMPTLTKGLYFLQLINDDYQISKKLIVE